MLAAARIVLERLCLAQWRADGVATGSIRIDIQGCDPRIVVVPRIWLERASETAGTIPPAALWTAYSAGYDSRKNLVPLQVVDGTLNRPIQAAGHIDGTIPQGDNLELQCATPVILIVNFADSSGILSETNAQSCWCALEAYPADPSLSEQDFDRLLHLIRCSQPSQLSLLALM